MTILYDPRQIGLPPMLPDCHDVYRLPWTQQPGNVGVLHVSVLGPGPTTALLQATAESAAQDELPDLYAPIASGAKPGGGTVVLREYQQECVDAILQSWRQGSRAPLVVLPTGCHAIGQGILMANGPVKRVEDVVVGDRLMGMDGTPRNVLRLCRGRGRMYRIVPAHGRPWVVNEDHVLTLATRISDDKPPRLFDISLKDWLSVPTQAYLVRAVPWGREGYTPARVPFAVEALSDEDDYYGFTLDGDQRYLLDDFTVTHNSGKTIVAASVMERAYAANKRSLFIAHRKELLKQTVDKIKLVASGSTPPGVGIVQASRNQLGRDITVASTATLKGAKRLAEVIEAGPYHVIFLDEAHHAPSKTNRRILDALRERYPDARLAGLTATPARSDGLALDLVFDRVCYQRSVFELIDLGFLTPVRGIQPHLDVKFDQVKTSDNGDYDKDQLSKVLNTPHVNRAMVSAWQEFGEDRKTLVFAVDVAHAAALTEEFTDAGYSAAYVHGAMKSRDRERIFNRFASGEIKLLLSVEVALEGYDEPSIECVFWARPTQSQGLMIQGIGRGVRLYPGKFDCLVVDPVGNLTRHEMTQLASLAGFDPATGHRNSGGSGEHSDDDELYMGDEPETRTVNDVTITGATAIDLRRTRQAQYSWRETSLGWVLLIPNIGYYMIVWYGTSKRLATIRFYDQRPGRRDEPARDVIAEPIEFDLAFGLIEGEMDRFFRAREQRGKARAKSGALFDRRKSPPEFAHKDDSAAPTWTFVDLEEGLEEDIHVPEALMMNQADWHERPITGRQKELLIKLGGKKRTLPSTAGEASGLIAILLIERDAKMRLPATEKQIAYLRINRLPMAKTKGEAARHIWQHRKAQLEQETR